MKSWLYDARKVSNLTPEDCASALGKSKNTYASRENNPGSLTLNEIRALGRILSPAGKKIMQGALVDIQS